MVCKYLQNNDGVQIMAYYADPTNLFTGYVTDEGGFAVFPVSSLPTCSGNPANLTDIKEILFSMLSVVDDDYAVLPAYASGVNTQTKSRNFTISSTISTNPDNTIRKTFNVSFLANSQILDVADEPEYNPD